MDDGEHIAAADSRCAVWMSRFFGTAFWLLLACLIVPTLSLAALFIWGNSVSFDTTDPDFAWISVRLSEIQTNADSIGVTDGAAIDFAGLNKGNWMAVCAIGGFNDPIDVIIEQGGRVSEMDRARLEDKYRVPVRLSIIEEFEFMIAYTDRNGGAHFIHFPRGIGSGGQHFLKCISRPETVMVFD